MDEIILELKNNNFINFHSGFEHKLNGCSEYVKIRFLEKNIGKKIIEYIAIEIDDKNIIK